VLTTVRDNLVTFEAFDQIGGGSTPEPYSLVESWSVRLPGSPVVSLTQPTPLTTFTEPADIHLVAEASDPDGTVVEVSFLAGATVIGTATSAPYEMTWQDVPAGSYSLTAVARDDSGATTTSAPVAITVDAMIPNGVPTAQAQAVTVAEDGVVGITLSGTDPEGEALTYAIVNAPAHGTLQGSGVSWSYAPALNFAGADSFSFRVTDAAGQASDPAVVSITVTAVNDVPVAAFTVIPATGTAPLVVGVDAGGSSDVEGPLAAYQWSFGDGGTGSGLTASHTYTLAGSYVVTLTVTDSQGATATTTRAVTVTPAAGWWDAGWTRRKKLVFNASAPTTALVDFPVLVKLDASRIDYASAQPGGADLRFVDADGVTLLPYEIEQWVSGGTSYVWVKVPRVDAGSTTDHVWMYYGNAGATAGANGTAVWSGFRGVWHLTGFADATGLGHAGVNQGSTLESAGRIGQARRFSGSSQYVQVAHAADLAFAATGSYTLSAWAKLDKVPGAANGVVTKSRNVSPWYGISIAQGKRWTALAPSANIAGAVAATGWSHVVVVQDGAAGARRLYVNGVLSGSGSARAADGTGPLWFGGSAGVNEYLAGVVDEVRLSGVARSADWVAAERLSESDAFVTFQD
jgi:PKD repeat protein